ncbi:MAG: energy transducer TonB [Gemmatimonadaceae bacterium]
MPFQTVGKQPDVAPVMLNKELPFRYPPALYAQKVQGNVTLRIFIDREGSIVSDSTRIAETSGFTALDSAAMKGSRELKFEPAKTMGQPVPVSILLPVYFRHPDAPPLAGDSIIGREASAASSSTASSSAKTADSAPKATTRRR